MLNISEDEQFCQASIPLICCTLTNVYLQRQSLTQAKYPEQAGEMAHIYCMLINTKEVGGEERLEGFQNRHSK